MPDLFDVLKGRRSVRKLTPKQVPKELLVNVLEAAGWAPSAHNAQPYRIVVLEDVQLKRRLANEMARVWATDSEKNGLIVDENKRIERLERFANAPVLLLACSTAVEGLPHYGDERRQGCLRDLGVQSLGAALENLFLAAYAFGLGGCWYSAPCFCRETVRSVVGIPEDVEPQALVVLGYPAEPPPIPKKKTLGEYCFLDVWGKPLRF